VIVDGKRVENQPGKPLVYQSTALLTCQHCGRNAVPHSMRVVCEPDERCKGGVRYFHALVEGQRQSLCSDCAERDRAKSSPIDEIGDRL
jgi:hypothetical protein